MSYGIDLGNSSIKVVSLHRKLRGFAVTGASRRRLPKPPTPEERKALYAKLLKDSVGAGAARRAGVLGLSGRDINLQLVHQPNTKAAEYRKMMGYEIMERRSGDQQLYADFCTLREPDSYFPQYLAMVGVGKAPYVDERIEIAASCGIDVRDAVPNAFALYAAYKNAYGAEGGTNMILDIGADNMDMALVRGGKLIYARNISSGARLFDANVAGMANSPAEEGEFLKIRYGSLLAASDNADVKEEDIRPAVRTAAGQLAGFIQASMNKAKIEFEDKDLAVDKVYLCGGGAKLRGFPEYLQSSLKIPVELFDPFQNLDTAAVEQMGVEDFRALPTDMAVPIGLAQLALMPTETSTLSILPDRIKARRNFFRTWLYIGAGAAAILVSLLVLTVIALARRGSVKSQREEFESQAKVRTTRIAKLSDAEQRQQDLLSRLDQLALPTLAPKAMVDVVSEIRQFGDPGITIREMKIVDPNLDASRSSDGPRRCMFRHAELGLVIGEVESKNEGSIKVRMDHPLTADAREFLLDECVDLKEWDGDVRVVIVIGDVIADVPGKANKLLDDIKRRLSKEQRGQLARTAGLTDSDRPGWRRFEIAVICQVRYE